MYKDILSNLPYPVSFVDINYVYKAVNEEYTKYFDTSIENIIGKKVSMFFGENIFNNEIKPNIDKCFSGVEVIYEVNVPFPNGKTKVMQMHYSPFYSNDKLIGLVSHGKDITREKELEKELKYNQTYLNNIFQKSPNISIVTNGEEIDKANDKMLEFTGYNSLDDFKLDHDCICDLFLEGENLIQAKVGELSWLEYVLENPNIEHKIAMLKNNKKYYFKIDTNEIKFDNNDRYKIVFTNITPLIEVEKKLEDIFNINPNITIITDGEELLKANNEFLNFTNFESIEHFKQNYSCICDMFEEQNGYITKYVDNQLWIDYIYKNSDQQNQALIKNNDKENIFEINVVKIKDQFLVSFYDITTLIEKDKLLIAQSRSAAMGEMINMIAHQWRQPLSVLSMTANNMLADCNLNIIKIEEFQDYSNSIQKQTNFLSKTIDDFRNFFKPNNEKKMVILENFIIDTLSFMEHSLKNNDIEIFKDFKYIGEVNIYSNELSHVLINLLKNSKEALIERKVTDKKIYIRTYKIEDTIFIEVEDNAGGIDKNIIDKIFDPYFSTKENLNGTGLGLYMSNMIIKDHFKGSINVTNSNKGVKFIVSFKI